MPDQESTGTASRESPAEPIVSIEPIPSIEPVVSTEETTPIAPVESPAAIENPVAEAPVEPAVIEVVTPEPSTGEAQPLTTEVKPPEPIAQGLQAPVVLTEIVANAGLEWVQTRSDLVVAEGTGDALTQRPPRPTRIRKPKVEIAAEPLQMVETKNDVPL